MTCKTEHNLPASYKDWPDWAKALADSEQQERRYEQRCVEHEPETDCLQTRGEMVDGLPTAPYDDDAANAAYRRANRLKG